MTDVKVQRTCSECGKTAMVRYPILEGWIRGDDGHLCPDCVARFHAKMAASCLRTWPPQ
jgi:hypothetical protein